MTTVHNRTQTSRDYNVTIKPRDKINITCSFRKVQPQLSPLFLNKLCPSLPLYTAAPQPVNASTDFQIVSACSQPIAEPRCWPIRRRRFNTTANERREGAPPLAAQTNRRYHSRRRHIWVKDTWLTGNGVQLHNNGAVPK